MSHPIDTPAGEDGPPANEQIDLYDRATKPNTDDEILEGTNLGLGNYDSDWVWMQVESYRKWIYAHAALAKPMQLRVVDYALTQAAIEAWDEQDHSSRESEWASIREHIAEQLPETTPAMDRRRWIQAKKEDLWNVDVDVSNADPEVKAEVRRDQRMEIVEEYGRGDLEWTPPFGRMIKTRHEASRSLGARVLDNLFGRVKKQEQEIREPDADSGGLRERLQ